MYRLHGFAQSGNTYKVAFLLRALAQPWQSEFVDFMGGVTRTAPWRERENAMGELPILEDGALRLTQSGVILDHLVARHGVFGGRDEAERREVLRWILFDNHKFTSYFASYRFNKSFGPTAPDPAVMGWLRARIDNAFGIVDRHLADRAFMIGARPTIADFSLCGYLFYPVAESDYPIEGRFANLHAWRERMRALPGWGDPYEILPGEPIAPRW